MFHCMIFKLYCLTDYNIDYLCTHLWMRIVWSLLFCSITESLTFRGKWMPVRALPDPRGLVAPGDSARTPSPLLYSNIASIVFMVLLYAWVLQYSLYCIAVDVLFFSVQLPILRISSKFRITSVQAFKKFQWYMCKLMFWCCLYL